MASRVVRARLDAPAERALSTLMGQGLNESEAVRTALIEAGARRRRRSALSIEAERLAADPADVAAQRVVLDEMDRVGARWPD